MLRSLIRSIFIVLFLCSVSFADIIINYGFEDWTGHNGTVSPGDGYIFGTDTEGYWTDDHITGTSGIAGGDTNCNSLTAYEGSWYWHLQFDGGEVDPCLGTAPGSQNNHNNFGKTYTYPTGTSANINITDNVSNIITIRFYFRTHGDWTSAQTGIDNGGGLKFIRLYGDDGIGDDSSILLKCLNDGDDEFPNFGIFENDIGHVWYDVGINWQDGNWHSVTMIVTRNNDTNTGDNITLDFWIDDWDGDGTANSLDYHVPDAGAQYEHIVIMSNWSGQAVINPLGFDVDKMEVWDGMPTGSTVPNVDFTGNNTTVYTAEALTIQGTATATTGRTITGITSPGLTVTCDDGTCDEIEEAFSASSGILDAGLNSFVFTAEDNTAETGQGTFTVTYVSTIEACTEVGGSGSTVLGPGTVILN